jgi:hypothetical protein
MPSPFDTAIAAGLASIRQVTQRSIVYSDGVHSPVTISLAGAADTEYELDDGTGIIETWTSRDYLIAVADLVINGVPTLPAKGHTITEVINGLSKVFTVLAPPGKQVYEFSDRGQTAFRVHTQETA